MKRGREEEEIIRWKEPGYLGCLSWVCEKAQDKDIRDTDGFGTYYISERGPLVVVSYPIHDNSCHLMCRKWHSWDEAVAFAKKLRSERNLVPLKRQDSIVFHPIYIEIREAIHSWTLCARRLGLPRDVRQLISEILYNRPWEWKN